MAKRAIRTLTDRCVHRNRFESLQHVSSFIGYCIILYKKWLRKFEQFLSGNSGHKVQPWMAVQTGVFDGEEISTAQASYAHAGI